jgi:uncharacterized protein (DUF305 family)
MGRSTGAIMSGSMMGMTGDGMQGRGMTGHGAMGGPATDRMYLQMMIAHHQLAVDMAEQAQQRATHPDIADLAATMATEQSAEIDRMRGYLTDLSEPPRN